MDSLSTKLYNIIICAKDIIKELDYHWEDLFIRYKREEIEERLERFKSLGKEFEDVYRQLGIIRDSIYEELTDYE